MDRNDSLWRLTRRQHGLVTPAQAEAVGTGRHALAQLVRRGDLERASGRVLRATAAPRTSTQRTLLAILHHGDGACADRTTALALWGVPGFDLEPAHVLLPRRRRTQPGPVAVVHTTTHLPDRHTAVLDGIPTTTVARALFDVAGDLHPKRVERAMDGALARRLTDVGSLHRTVAELGGSGRPGTDLMRRLTADRPLGSRPPESNTEARLNELLVQDGQAPLIRQVDVGDGDSWIGRVDLRDADLPLVIEVQSQLFHGSLVDRSSDHLRLGRLRGAGFTVLEIWEEEVWRRPRRAVGRVRSARASLKRAVQVADLPASADRSAT
jgi:very-short-patch-repair endonuclease